MALWSSPDEMSGLVDEVITTVYFKDWQPFFAGENDIVKRRLAGVAYLGGHGSNVGLSCILLFGSVMAASSPAKLRRLGVGRTYQDKNM